MIPILYEKTETSFQSNGVGRLAECVSCAVTEERNGIYEAEFVYPITGRHYDDIKEGMIVSLIHDDSKTRQPFVIYRRTAPIDGLVTFYAHHISYRLSNIIVQAPVTAETCAEALAALFANTVGDNPFTAWTDKTTQAHFALGYPVSIKQILGGVRGSILDVFGGGEYEWDGFTVKLYQNRGTRTAAEIRYGKNLVDITKDLDTSGVYNAVVPYWYSEETGQLVTLSDKVIKADAAFTTLFPWTNEAGTHIQTQTGQDIEFAVMESVADSDLVIVPMDLSSEFDEAPTEAQLRALAKSRLDNSQAWIPDENIEVDFAALWQTEEYKDIAPLERVKLCDTLRVVFADLGVNATMKVIKTTYNVLLERYDKIELGKAKTSFAEVLMASTEEIVRQLPTKGFLEAALEKSQELITGGLGGYVVMNLNADGEPQEILIMDTDDKATAVNVIRLNKNGIGFSTSGYGGPFNSAWTIDGTFNAQLINVVNLTANAITSGTMSADRILGGTMRLGKVGEVFGELITYEANYGRVVFAADMYGVKGRSNDVSGLDNGGLNAFGYLDGVAYSVPSGSSTPSSELTVGNMSTLTAGGRTCIAMIGHHTDGRPVAIRRGNVPATTTTDRDASPMGGRTGIDDMFVGSSQYTHYEYKGDRLRYGIVGPSRQIWVNLGIQNDRAFFTISSHPVGSGSIYTLVDFYDGHLPAYQSTSSRRYKHDIRPLSGDRDPEKLLRLPAVEFTYNDGHPLQYADTAGKVLPGLIAEDVAEIYPSAVITDAEGRVESWDERRILPGMLALIQRQEKTIEAVEKKLAALEARIAKLEGGD